MTLNTVKKIFKEHGFPVYFAEYGKVALNKENNEKGYKTVFLTLHAINIRKGRL